MHMRLHTHTHGELQHADARAHTHARACTCAHKHLVCGIESRYERIKHALVALYATHGEELEEL